MINKNVKKIILFGLILILTIGIVSATNNTDTNTQHQITKTNQEHNTTPIITKNPTDSSKILTKNTNTTNKESTNTYTTTANDYKELVNKVNEAKSTNYDTYTINLKKGTYNATSKINWDETNGTKKLIINGNQATLNGQNKRQFMTIGNEYMVTLNNIKITNFKNNNNGGAINSKGTLTLNNVQFTNNTSRFSNGKIYFDGENVFINNYGGAIFSNGPLTINNSQFLDNAAETNGGAIYSKGTLTINNSKFINNTSKNYGVEERTEFETHDEGIAIFPPNNGGAICSIGKVNINNSQFINNAAESGGAVYSTSTLTINNSQFAKNTPSSIRGKVINVYYSQFTNDGGLMSFLRGIINVHHSQFTNNTGTILDISEANVSIYDSQFTNNLGRSLSSWISNVTIYKSQFTNNTPGIHGNVISSNYGTLTVYESQFINNTAEVSGGAIYSYSDCGNLTIYDSLFVNNGVTGGATTSCYGGAISSNNLYIYDSEFINNTSLYGGAISSSGKSIINNTQFTNNSAKIGKSLYIGYSHIDLINNNFTGKYSQEIKLNGGNLTITNNYFNKEKMAKYHTSNLHLDLHLSCLNGNEDILGNNITISGYVTAEGKIVGKEVYIKVNNETFTTTTGEYGEYRIDYKTRKLGKNTVSVTYNKTTEYNSNIISSTFYCKTNTSIVLFKTPVATKGKVSKISGKLLSNNKGIKGADIIVDVNGKKYTAKTYSSGYFTINYLVPTFNKRTVTVTYNGSSLYLPATNKTTFNVKQKTKINILTKGTFTKGKVMNISGKLRLTKNNNGIKGQKIIVTIGSEKFNAKTDSTGYFSIKYKVKTYDQVKVKISFNGNTNYLESSNTTSFKVKQKTQLNILTSNKVSVGKTVKISGKLLSNNKGVKDAKISIVVGSKKYTATTYSTGYFTVNTVFKYSSTKIPLKFVFEGSTLYLSSSNSTSLTTVKS